MSVSGISSNAPLGRREQLHRRQLLMALAAMLVLSVSPVFGHHLLGSVPWLPATQQHAGVFCLVAMHLLLAPVHVVAHWLLYGGVALAVIDRTRAFLRHRAVMYALPSEVATNHPEVARAARQVGLDASRVLLVSGLPNPAFTSGWWRPRVYIARELPQRLASDELEAVLAHEAEHVRRRDPLRLFWLRALARVLFWLPALGRLADDLADEWEITADDAAARTHALPLASAILRMSGVSAQSLDPAVGFHESALFARRVRRLAGEEPAIGTHVSRRSLAAAAGALLLVWLSGVMVLHPLALGDEATEGGGHSAHCDHSDAFAISHIFCRGLALGSHPEACPHSASADGTYAAAVHH